MNYELKGVRFSGELLKKVEEFSVKESCTFSAAVRKLVLIGLKKNGNTSEVTASELPDFEKRRLFLDVKTMYMIDELLSRLMQDNYDDAIKEITNKTNEQLREHFF